MVYLQTGTHTYKCRITAADDRFAVLSTGCRDKADAEDVEKAVRRWEGKKGAKYARPALVVALIDKRITLADAFEASLDGTLDRLLSEAPVEPVPVRARDVTSFVADWHDWQEKQRKGARSADDYLRQLRTLFPEIGSGRLTLAHFTRVEIAKRLDGLDVQGPTKNRYKLAASGFAKFLRRRGVLETNIVRDIEGFGENPARMVYYERGEAMRLVLGLHQPIAGVAAFACGFCMEWGAISALMARDVSLVKGDEQVYVRGTKTKNRLRTVPLVEENRWLLPVVQAAIAGKAPNARVFDGLNKRVAIGQQQRVARALKIAAVGEDRFSQHGIHDWRHTHTVQLLRDGYGDAIAAAHLGHANTDLVHTRYGLFIVKAEDYRRTQRTTDSTTTTATTLQRGVK